ncbi:MAG: glutamate racemase [Solirubrobacterales bacterium]
MKPLCNRHEDAPIGVFDSGVGGLTVAAALARRLPSERLLYLGDIARLPYGTKAPETVIRYALQAGRFLAGRGVKMLVVACNTASAHALPALAAAHPGLPVLGVVEAGAAAAAQGSAGGRIVVIATEGTCRSGAFERAILGRRPAAEIACVPCPLFVALAEEGLTSGPIAEGVARQYLDPWFSGAHRHDCIVLGCTHFPLLAATVRRVIGDGPIIVDCADAVADAAARLLAEHGLAAADGRTGDIRLVTTDAPDRFARVAGRFFPNLQAPPPELVDL